MNAAPSAAIAGVRAALLTLGALALLSVVFSAALEPPRASFDSQRSGSVLRRLPFPFSAAVTVADDVDLTRWVADAAIKSELRTGYGLDWTRSMHMYSPPREREGFVALSNRADGSVSDAIVNGGDFHNSTYQLARSFHRGEIDYVHMWSDFGHRARVAGAIDYPSLARQVGIIDQQRVSATVGREGSGSSAEVRVVRGEPVHFPGVRFYLETSAGVRWVELVISDRRGREFRFCFAAPRSADCSWRGELPPPGVAQLRALFLREDAVQPVAAGRDPLTYRWSSVRLVAHGDSGATAAISELAYSAFNRELVERQQELLERLNIGFLSYSDHGGSDNGVNLFRWGSAERGRTALDSTPWDQVDELTGVHLGGVPEGDRPGSAYYFADLLRNSGAVFYLFGNDQAANVIAPNELRGYTLAELLVPYTPADGRRVYNVQRYFPALWREGENGTPYSITWNSRFGQVLDDVLARADRLAPDDETVIFGPIVTHLGFEGEVGTLGRVPHAIEPGDAFDDATDAALSRLSARVYNFGGRIGESRRIWAPSINRLYRYAQMMQSLPEHIDVDATDRVRIDRWRDEVTGELLPAPREPGKFLHGVTVYVADSQRATVTIEGREFDTLLRNPADRTGRESITLVDDSTPRVVFDEVWPSSDAAGWAHGEVMKSPDAPAGRSWLRVDSGPDRQRHRLTAIAPAAARDITAVSYLSFYARSTDPQARLRVAYTLADGRTFRAEVAPTRPTARGGWAGTWAAHGQWRRFVFAFHTADFRQQRSPQPPRGILRDLVLDVSARDVVDIDQIAFLRDNPNPVPQRGHVVAGRVLSELDDVEVVLHRADGGSLSTTTANQGYYLFPRIAHGEIARIEARTANGSIWYDGGRAVEVHSDLVELDIMPDGTAVGRTAAIARESGRIAWTSGLVPRNRSATTRPLPLVPSRFGPLRAYDPDRLVEWWGSGTHQEYDTYQYVNNLGFLDRERDPADATSARRYSNILLFGDCLFAGDQFAQELKISTLLEQGLQARLKRPVQTPLLASTTLAPYHFSLLYDAIGRQFKPELALVSVMMSTFRNASPSLRAEEMGLAIGAHPDEMLDVGDDGSFMVRPADATFFRKQHRWTRAWHGGSAHRFSTYLEPTDWMRDELSRSTRIITESLRRLRDSLRADGARMVLVLAQDRNALSWSRRGNDGAFDYDAELADERFRAIAAELDVHYLNLVKEIEKRDDYLTAQWVFDPHWTAAGHRMTTEILIDYLLEHELVGTPAAGTH